MVISPMLCTLTKEPPDNNEYLFEVKWDGYRIISYIKGKTVRMNSRGGLDYTKKYPPIARALKELGRDVILDGEMVVFNENGNPDFDALQLYNGHETPITYCVFDLLWLDGRNLMKEPLTERKKRLKELVKGNKTIRFSESYEDGHGLLALAKENNLEGIIAKRRNSTYQQGVRGNDWLKIPAKKRQEFVIGGWAESEKARSFRSLLFGAYKNGKLEWIGRSGGGYKEKEMPGILRQLKELETGKSPFVNSVLDTKGVTMHWVKPKLVANFEFATWTKSGRIRKPATFLGFRKDKKATQVVREIPFELNKPSKKLKTNYISNWPTAEKQDKEDAIEVNIDECITELYNTDRKIWKNFTKAKLIHYYHDVADHILPYIKNRPQSLHLKLNGAHAPGVYIKDMEGRQPECGDIFKDKRRHKARGKRNVIEYLVCNNEATLLWMINLGCIDINPWNSTVSHPLEPDYLVIDLDPSEKKRTEKGLTRLRNVAMAAKELCNEYGLKAFVKTSGKTGIHFLLPCTGFNFAQARAVTVQICQQIQALVPAEATVNTGIAQRGDKIYIDPSQNDYADTIAAPYSVRPFEVPLVSTPLEWKEVNNKLDPQQFSIEAVQRRLKMKGDLFADLFKVSVKKKNSAVLKKLL